MRKDKPIGIGETDTLEIDELKYSDPGQLIVPVNNLLILITATYITIRTLTPKSVTIVTMPEELGTD